MGTFVGNDPAYIGAVTSSEIETPRGPAGIQITEPDGPPVSLLVLGHGAGGGVGAPDLTAVHDAAVAAGVRVVLVTQPYRMAGRRAAAPTAQLDEAWTAVIEHLRAPGLPMIFGGRSSGARVACRTAAPLGAVGVLALAVPLHPPGKPEKSRAPELTGVAVPIVVVQGETDAFGRPEDVAAALSGHGLASVYAVPGDHSLKKNPGLAAAAALSWLTEVLPA